MPKSRLLLIDDAAHALLLVEEPGGKILHEIKYPPEYTPVDIAATSDGRSVYLPSVSTGGKNIVLKIDFEHHQPALTVLPLSLPYPAQFALDAANNPKTAYINEPGGAVYRLDLDAMTICPIVAPLKRAVCVGLAADGKYLYSAWEHECGGTVAIFDFWGKLQRQYDIAGIPTNIILDCGRKIIVPFTNTAFTGEGVAVFDIEKSKPANPFVITIQCPSCPSGLAAYPCHAAVTPDGRLAYIASEDSASVLVLNLKTASIADRLVIGRSISRLYLIPQSHIAVATSNLFGDLCRIDLKNGELMAITATGRNILGYLAVLPDMEDNEDNYKNLD